MTKRKSARAVNPDDVLAELLIECRDGVRSCVELANDADYRCEAMSVAARLVKTSIALVAALKKTNADFTHRIIVERAGAAPPTPQISGKTIHSVQAPEDRKIG